MSAVQLFGRGHETHFPQAGRQKTLLSDDYRAIPWHMYGWGLRLGAGSLKCASIWQSHTYNICDFLERAGVL